MQTGNLKLVFASGLTIVWATFLPLIVAADNIIQQEKMSFDTCLKVITTSQDKLSIVPEVSNLSNQKTVAIFELSDGTLTIECDGEQNLVTVSTKLN